MEALVHLHVHSHTSSFDGVGRFEEFANRAAEMGQPAVALTDHGTLRGLHEAQIACDVAGVKFIPGVEAYVVDDAESYGLAPEEKRGLTSGLSKADATKLLKGEDAKRKERDHVTIWALTDVGLHNLYRLMSWAWTTGFYYRARIDMKRLAQFGEGLAVSTGCPTGMVPAPLREGRVDEALARAEQLREIFGDRLYVEIMPHHVGEARAVNAQLVRIAVHLGVKVIATQDAHYPLASDARAQEVLLCIHTRGKMSDPARYSFGGRDYWLRSRDEMERAFREGYPDIARKTVLLALDETMSLADRCSTKVPKAPPGAYLAAPSPPEGLSHSGWLEDLCDKGLGRIFGLNPSTAYQERLTHELSVISERGFAPYFLMVWDLRKWALDQKIPCGPGRGSSVGSLVSYVLGITDLDPVEWGLSFNRFIGPGRKRDLPDIDLDFGASRRGEIVEYLRQKYGADKVAQISTAGTFGAKSLIHDLARIYEIPRTEAELVAKSLDFVEEGAEEEGDEASDSLTSLLDKAERGREFASNYPEAVELGARLQGQLRHVGVHPAGMVVSSVPLEGLVPLETRGREGSSRIKVIAFDMEGVAAAGLEKIDALGLTMLDVLGDVLEETGIDARQIPYEGEEVLEVFRQRRFSGIFQFDSGLARRLARKFLFRGFRDVAVFTALNRPGPLDAGLSEEYVCRQNDPSRIVPVHPIYDEVTTETLGLVVYQEEVIALAEKLAGMSPVEADALRKGIAKKTGVEGFRDPFVDGCVQAGLGQEEAESLFGDLRGFAEYAFNKSHAHGYARVSFMCAYMKAHYAPQYLAALLAHEADAAKRTQIAAEARALGIRIVPPDVSMPVRRFTATEESGAWKIVGALDDVKGVGPAAAKALVETAPYRSVVDMRRKLAKQRFTVAQFEALARAGALRSLFSHRRLLVSNCREIWKDAERGISWDLHAPPVEDYSPEESAAVAMPVYPLYTDAEGKAEIDRVAVEISERSEREVVAPSEVAEGLVDSAFALGTVEELREQAGGDVVRLGLAGVDGVSAPVKAYGDVVASCPGLVKGAVVLALLSHSLGGAHADWMRLVGTQDGMFRWALRPGRTRPRDPSVAAARTEEEGQFVVQGMIFRRREHWDRLGNLMFTATLVGMEGSTRFFVFAGTRREMKPAQIHFLDPGSVCQVRLRKLSRGAAALVGPRSITKLDDALA